MIMRFPGGARATPANVEEQSVAPFQRPAEGTWTEHYPELGTGPVSFEESISPAFYELEREPISRTWPASCGTSAPDGVQNIRALVIGRNRRGRLKGDGSWPAIHPHFRC